MILFYQFLAFLKNCFYFPQKLMWMIRIMKWNILHHKSLLSFGHNSSKHSLVKKLTNWNILVNLRFLDGILISEKNVCLQDCLLSLGPLGSFVNDSNFDTELGILYENRRITCEEKAFPNNISKISIFCIQRNNLQFCHNSSTCILCLFTRVANFLFFQNIVHRKFWIELLFKMSHK